MALEGQDFTMYAGETKTLSVTGIVNVATGALVDFTGATPIKWVMYRAGVLVVSKTLGAGITVAGLGALTIVTGLNSVTGLSGEYEHECRATLSDGTTATLFVGSATFKPTLVN